MAQLDLQRFNQRIREAGKDILSDIKREADAEGIVHRENSPSKGASIAKMKDKYKQQDGAVNKISYVLNRSLIYTHKGAGKGRGGAKGSSWVNKYGVTKTTKETSKGKAGTGGRKEKPFINKILEQDGNGIDKIAFIAADELGAAIVNKMLIQ